MITRLLGPGLHVLLHSSIEMWRVVIVRGPIRRHRTSRQDKKKDAERQCRKDVSYNYTHDDLLELMDAEHGPGRISDDRHTTAFD